MCAIFKCAQEQRILTVIVSDADDAEKDLPDYLI